MKPTNTLSEEDHLKMKLWKLAHSNLPYDIEEAVRAIHEIHINSLKRRAKQYDNCTEEERVYIALEQPELQPYLKPADKIITYTKKEQ